MINRGIVPSVLSRWGTENKNFTYDLAGDTRIVGVCRLVEDGVLDEVDCPFHPADSQDECRAPADNNHQPDAEQVSEKGEHSST